MILSTGNIVVSRKTVTNEIDEMYQQVYIYIYIMPITI